MLEKLTKFRSIMQKLNIHGYLVPHNDSHNVN